MMKKLIFSLMSLLAGNTVIGSEGIPEIPVDIRCALSVSQPVIDYGTQTRWQLQDRPDEDSVTRGVRSLTLTAVFVPRLKACSSYYRGRGRSMARSDMASYIRVRLMEAQLDGQSVNLQSLTDNGTPADQSMHPITLAVGQRIAAGDSGSVGERENADHPHGSSASDT